MPEDHEILFVPDRHLGQYLEEVTGRKMILWDGACMVHEIFSVGDLLALKKKLPGAMTIAHPECPANIREHTDFVGGTEAMIKYVGGFAEPTDFLVATEANMIWQLADASTRGTATTRCPASPAPATSARTWPATRWKSSATACSTASRRSPGSRSSTGPRRCWSAACCSPRQSPSREIEKNTSPQSHGGHREEARIDRLFSVLSVSLW